MICHSKVTTIKIKCINLGILNEITKLILSYIDFSNDYALIHVSFYLRQ